MRERFFLGPLLVVCLALVVSCEPASTPAPEAPPMPTAEVEEMVTRTPWRADGLIGEGEYLRKAESAGVQIYWSNDDDHLYVAMAAKTDGWVAVGFAPEDRMKGANFILGYVKDGEAFIWDMFGVESFGPGSHPLDEELGGTNDVVEYAGREEGGLTVIEFKLPLDSDDRYDKPLKSGESYKLIAAVGPSDDFASKHVSRGYSQITID